MNSARKFNIKINGTDYSVEIKNVDEGLASVDVNGSMYEVEFEVEKKVSKTPTLVRTPAYTTQAERPKSTAKPEENKGRSIKAPLPGVILEISASVGDTVQAGQVLLVMEAMKMENNIVSPVDGMIKTIHVSKGDNVLEGDALIEIGG